MPDDHSLRQSYDDLPYETRARRKTHPDTLATIATLFGLDPPAVNAARVLEIGCGTGENLVAIAGALPDAACTGIDLSASQIAMARNLAAAAGIKNADFHVRDFGDLVRTEEPFDYVIAHGVLSWIPLDRHRDLLDRCSHPLAPGGLLYLSYNALPGWHQRRIVRDHLLRAVDGIRDADARVRTARDSLAQLADIVGESESSYGKLVREERDNALKLGDSYLAHDLLETYNTAFYFDDAVSMARDHDLHFVGEAAFEAMVPDTYPGAIADALKTIPALYDREQALDFLINRTFRESIFCKSRQAAMTPQLPRLARLLYAARLQRKPGPSDAESVVYQDVGGREIAMAPGAAQQAIDTLSQRFPEALTFEEIVAGLAVPAPADQQGIVGLINALFVLYSRGFVSLHSVRPGVVALPGKLPRAPGLARAQCARGTRVTTALLENLEIDDPDCRVLLPLLDGTRDIPTLAAALPPDSEIKPTYRVTTALSKLARVGLIVE